MPHLGLEPVIEDMDTNEDTNIGNEQQHHMNELKNTKTPEDNNQIYTNNEARNRGNEQQHHMNVFKDTKTPEDNNQIYTNNEARNRGNETQTPEYKNQT